MAISFSNLTKGNSAAASSVNTASITPSANALVLVTVSNGSSSDVQPTISGCSLTFVAITSFENNQNRFTVFRALGASPTTGALTIDFAGNSQDQTLVWAVDQATGVNKTGTNGSGAIVQSVGAASIDTNVSSITETLAALASPNNAAWGGITSFLGSGSVFTSGGSFTQLSSQGRQQDTGWNQNTEWAINQTAVNWTLSAHIGTARAIALEIAAPAANTGNFLLFM